MLSYIRKVIINKRLALSREEVADKSNAINLKLKEIITDYMKIHHDIVFLTYFPLDNEVDINQTTNWLLEQKRQVYFPVSYADGIMDFFKVNNLEELKEGRFHVMEPPQIDSYKFAPESYTEKNVVIMTPGVVFDKIGNRMGHGIGYYDRYFERLHKSMPKENIISLGIAYDFQIVESLQAKSWDIPVDYVISE